MQISLHRSFSAYNIILLWNKSLCNIPVQIPLVKESEKLIICSSISLLIFKILQKTVCALISLILSFILRLCSFLRVFFTLVCIFILTKCYCNFLFFIRFTIGNFQSYFNFFAWLIVLKATYQFINTAYSLAIEFCNDRFGFDSRFICSSAFCYF